MRILFSFVTAFLGVILGGFLCRAARAVPRRSFNEILSPCCPSCGRAYPRLALIPLVGLFLTKTRCPHCGERRGVEVLLSELVFGAVSLLLYLEYSFSYLFFLYWIAAGTLLVLSLIDLDVKEAPHGLLFIILLLGVLTLVFSFFDFSLTGTIWWEHLVGAFVISLPLFLLMIITGGIGGGDVKAMFVLGLLLGYKLTIVAFFFGILAAAAAGIVLHFVCDKGAKYALPLIPFLSLGTVIAMLWGKGILALLF